MTEEMNETLIFLASSIVEITKAMSSYPKRASTQFNSGEQGSVCCGHP